MERSNTVKFVTGELQNESGNTSSVTNEEDIEIGSEPFETTCTIVENRSHKNRANPFWMMLSFFKMP